MMQLKTVEYEEIRGRGEFPRLTYDKNLPEKLKFKEIDLTQQKL